MHAMLLSGDISKTRKVILFLGMLSIFSIPVGGAIYYFSLSKYAIEEAKRDTAFHLDATKDRINSYIKQHLDRVESLAALDEIKETLLSPSRQTVQRANSLLEIFQKSQDENVCYVVNEEGKTVASSDPDLAASFTEKKYSFRPYFHEALLGKIAVYLAEGATSSDRDIYFVQPVYPSIATKPLGVVVLKAAFDPMLNEIKNAQDEIRLLLSPEGIIFATSRKEWQYHMLWKTPEKTVSSAVQSGLFGKGPWPWTGMKREEEFARDSEGNRYEILEIGIDIPGWQLVCIHDLEYLTKKITQPLFAPVALVVLVLSIPAALLVLFLYLTANRALSRHVQTGKMLSKAKEELEKRVKERTAELESANEQLLAEIGERKRLENQLRHISITDDLTGLLNRRGFFAFAEKHINLADRENKHVYMLFLDLDNMKTINDTLGHNYGDQALVEVATVLKKIFRVSDIISRLGGDEFAVLLLSNVNARDGRSFKANVEKALHLKNQMRGRKYLLSASIGVIRYDPAKHGAIDQLLSEADLLMYESKMKKKRTG